MMPEFACQQITVFSCGNGLNVSLTNRYAAGDILRSEMEKCRTDGGYSSRCFMPIAMHERISLVTSVCKRKRNIFQDDSSASICAHSHLFPFGRDFFLWFSNDSS